jgi:hypothetical protein
MLDLSLLALVLIPLLAYWLPRRAASSTDILPDYIVPRDMDERPCVTHWGVPTGVTRVNHALLTEVKCHPAFVERDVPDAWFKWSPAEARKRARARGAHDVASGILSIRKRA